MKKKYYSLDRLLDTKCNWLILYGMRSNGKSYAVKKYCLECAVNGRFFIYLRRWKEDIKEKDVSTYFDDMPVVEITNGAHDGIVAYRGFFYWYDLGADDKIVRSNTPIGRYCALNEYERYKSQVFQDYDNIIYEEFMTRKVYLGNSAGGTEPKYLMNFVSTVARDRDIKVFLIGNTETRVNPYMIEWNLKHMMVQKPGTIDIYHLKGENGVVDIAVENCEVVETRSRMFFGNASKQIINGEWDVDDYPKLLKPYQYYDMLYELTLFFGEFSYIMQLLCDPVTGGLFVYIYPNTKKRKTQRVITNQFNSDPFYSNGLLKRIRAECAIADCFVHDKVCFSDNLTGTDFKQVLSVYDFKGVK